MAAVKPQERAPSGSTDSLDRGFEEYLEDLLGRGRSPNTINGMRKRFRRFIGWCGRRRISSVRAVTRNHILAFAEALGSQLKYDGKPLKARTRHGYLAVVLAFFGWLHGRSRILIDPTVRIELPRLPRSLPAAVLTAVEAEQVLAQPDVGTKLGLRDRAILELLYSTGLRRGELVNLLLSDLDAERGLILVREGKGRRDRVVPIGDRGLSWIGKYLPMLRPLLAKEHDQGHLFLTRCGAPISVNRLTAICGNYLRAALPGRPGSCHVWRHTAATLMLDAGADTRHVQELLGHACLESTQVYTHVSVSKLKAVHEACHPAEQS